MKKYYVALAAAVTLTFTLLPVTTQARESCKLRLPNGNVVVGFGMNKDDAFFSAADKCFKRYTESATQSNGKVEEQAGLDSIDLCVNLQCES